MPHTAILLVNLGTPNSPDDWDVFHYLNEFLTDERVIDIPWLKRQALVRGIIVPKRFRESAATYRKVWSEDGSPLMAWGKKTCSLLQELLGNEYSVNLAMRYQSPSIPDVLKKIEQEDVSRLVVIPLFPQYASATSGSVHQKVMESIKSWNRIPDTRFINTYATHPKFIEAFAERGKEYPIDTYDHILFSFHGLPKKQLIKADRSGHCKGNGECCSQLNRKNQNCYSAQCYATAKAIAEKLNLSNYSICFQSRLGKDPWIEPYTSDAIASRAALGDKKLLVFCPAFVCDCLETIYEIGVEYQEEFVEAGGEKLDLVEGLNAHPLWIETLADLSNTQEWIRSEASATLTV